MLEVLNCVTPSAKEFQTVIHGMRNAFKSWERSDSCLYKLDITIGHPELYVGEEDVSNVGEDWERFNKSVETDFYPVKSFYLGENDKTLLMNLTKLGPSDRKVLRQLPIILEVNSPLYWWKQADCYRVGTVTNSESTMHTITKNPFTVDDFSIDHAGEVDEPEGLGSFLNLFESIYLKDLNYLRDKYLETGEDKYKKLLIEILPESYNQTRTWSLNLEVALQIIHQRKTHELTEWHQLIDYMLDNIPLLKELYEASCYKENTLKKLKAENKELRAEVEKLKGEDDE